MHFHVHANFLTTPNTVYRPSHRLWQFVLQGLCVDFKLDDVLINSWNADWPVVAVMVSAVLVS